MKNLLFAVPIALLAASFASAAGPQVTPDMVKECSNGTHTIRIVFDYLNYGNGDSNKIAIVKGFTVVVGTAVGTVDVPYALGYTPLKRNFQSPYQVFVHKASFDKWSVILDVVNGNNSGNYDNPAHYSVIRDCKLVD